MKNNIKNLKIVNPEKLLEKVSMRPDGLKDIVGFLKDYDINVVHIAGKGDLEVDCKLKDNIQGYLLLMILEELLV